jgi:hypothetical protein
MNLGQEPCSWGQGMPLGRDQDPCHLKDHIEAKASEAIDKPGL